MLKVGLIIRPGYILELLKRVIKYLLNDEDFYLVEANYISSNLTSREVMKKVVRKYDGTSKKLKIMV